MKVISAGIVFFAYGTGLHAAELPASLTLVTERQIVEITPRCPEGHVACDRVDYKGIHRETGATLALRGKTMHSTCADGKTPCRFLGYRFRKGRQLYLVWQDGDGETGRLEIIADGKVQLSEPGTWK